MGDPLRALRNAIRADMAYMEPTWGPNRHAQAFIEVVGGIQYLAVAGTNDLSDGLNDVRVAWVHRDALGYVRDGFADAWDPLRDAGITGLGLNPNLPTVAIGHSLGSPLAQYLVPVLENKGVRFLYGESFGSPTGWKRPAWAFPRCPWRNWKNGYDAVAGRPWLVCPGTAGGEWYQIDGLNVKSGMRHPATSGIKFWQAADNHRLQGRYGYISALGAICDAQGLTQDWRQLPEAQRWAVAVVAFEDRGKKPMRGPA